MPWIVRSSDQAEGESENLGDRVLSIMRVGAMMSYLFSLMNATSADKAVGSNFHR